MRDHHFSAFRDTGRYFLRIAGANATSAPFAISPQPYADYPDSLLQFMRQ